MPISHKYSLEDSADPREQNKSLPQKNKIKNKSNPGCCVDITCRVLPAPFFPGPSAHLFNTKSSTVQPQQRRLLFLHKQVFLFYGRAVCSFVPSCCHASPGPKVKRHIDGVRATHAQRPPRNNTIKIGARQTFVKRGFIFVANQQRMTTFL